jgi:hypothetical protein
MTPFSFEWQWNVEYFIFFGLLYLALTIVGCGIIYSYIKTWFDLMEDEEEEASHSKIDQRTKYSDY